MQDSSVMCGMNIDTQTAAEVPITFKLRALLQLIWLCFWFVQRII